MGERRHVQVLLQERAGGHPVRTTLPATELGQLRPGQPPLDRAKQEVTQLRREAASAQRRPELHRPGVAAAFQVTID
jgi:hypothetical protein